MSKHTIHWTDETGRLRADTLTAPTATAARERLATVCPEYAAAHTTTTAPTDGMIVKVAVPCGLTESLAEDLTIAAEFSEVKLVSTVRHHRDPALDVLAISVPTADLDTAFMILGDLMGVSCSWWPTADDLLS